MRYERDELVSVTNPSRGIDDSIVPAEKRCEFAFGCVGNIGLMHLYPVSPRCRQLGK
jgi:hypothetical protein